MKIASEFPPLIPRASHEPPAGARFLFRYNDAPASRVDRYALVEGGWIDVPVPGEGAAIKSASSTEGAMPAGATLSFGGRRFGKSWFAGEWLARQSRNFETMWADEADDIPLPAWFQLKTEPASAEDRAARKSPKVTVTFDFNPYEHLMQALVDWHDQVLPSDEPGIAAMAAKNVQPTPDPVVSISGEQVTESEIAQALQLLRGQNAPAVKETPRGLLCVREGFDHRLGAWRG